MDEATQEERRLILQHYVEVIEMTADKPVNGSGTYKLKLFPEATSPIDRVDTQDESEFESSDSSVLTDSTMVLQPVEKAPRLGLEPRT